MKLRNGWGEERKREIRKKKIEKKESKKLRGTEMMWKELTDIFVRKRWLRRNWTKFAWCNIINRQKRWNNKYDERKYIENTNLNKRGNRNSVINR